MYGASILQLAQFKRASAIAGSYQEYRITGVTFKFTPRFDTFPATTDASNQIVVPYLYYIIDKVGAIKAGATLAQLQSMGAKPHRFDDKTITVKYKPAVLQSSETNTATSTLTRPVTSPWLLTMTSPSDNLYAPSSVDHRGLWYILDAKNLPGDGQYEFDVDIQVDFQFRKPLLAQNAGVDATPQGGNVIPLV